MKDRDALDAVRAAAQWFPGRSDGVADRPSDVLPALLYLIGDARVVLIGEATHGTDEFYSIRSALTKALIRSKQFNLVAAEADWPDAYRVNRWVRHMREEPNAAAALGDCVRFPRWMLRNTVVMEYVVAQLVELRNAAAEYANRDGFVADDEYFFAEQNARLVRNAEMYYRAMFGGQVESWNLRDTHMMETLDALMVWTTKRSGYLAEPRLERPIGVIYKPESERASHYFRATMADQFDAVIHIDTTSALTPLEQWSGENSDLPETYPTGV